MSPVERRRVQQREAGREKWDRRISARNRTSEWCQRRHGRMGVCGGRLSWATVDGRAVQSCDLCERFKAGICRDCPRPVEGMKRRAVRCKACKRAAMRRDQQRHYRKNLDQMRARGRAWGRAHRAECSARRRDWVSRNRDRDRQTRQRRYLAKDRKHQCVDCPAELRGYAKRCPDCRAAS